MKDLRHHKSHWLVRLQMLLFPPVKRPILEERHWQRAANAPRTAVRRGVSAR